MSVTLCHFPIFIDLIQVHTAMFFTLSRIYFNLSPIPHVGGGTVLEAEYVSLWQFYYFWVLVLASLLSEGFLLKSAYG